MVLEGEELHFSVGSGITAGSVPSREYDETLHKATGMQMALEAYVAAEDETQRRNASPLAPH
jgi:para-aminobenzoate synthetase component 1